MTTKINDISSNSLGFVANPIVSSARTTCNICHRHLYAFEEVLQCRICQYMYHWRCSKVETVTYYGESKSFVCDSCSDKSLKNESSLHSKPDVSKSKPLMGSTTNDHHQNYTGSSPNLSHVIRYADERQQTPQTYRRIKTDEYDNYRSPSINGHEYSSRYGQYTDDNRYSKQNQENTPDQNLEIDDDEDTQETSTMFQANYQYTPLKDYAASNQNGRTNTETPVVDHESSPSNRLNRPRYANSLQYNNHGYDPTVARLIEIPRADVNKQFSSPTSENLSKHDRQQQHFVSTTNLNLNEKAAHRTQQTPPIEIKGHSRSSPYLAGNHSHDSSSLQTSPTRLQNHIRSPTNHRNINDQNSAVGSDSGIVMVTPNHHQQREPNEDKQFVERKLTDLVQQLGRQLETDAQKINEKLESKLKNLEEMIHQQTYIIRRQDEVIERLKSKISKIEGERDHFRDRLSYHEQEKRNQVDKKTNEQTKPLETPVKARENEDSTTIRKNSDVSSTSSETTKSSSRKKPIAPRIEQKPFQNNVDDRNRISNLVKQVPLIAPPQKIEQPSGLGGIKELVINTPLLENPPATNRLDHMIHRDDTKNYPNKGTNSGYNFAEVRHQDRRSLEPISLRAEDVISAIHQPSEHDMDRSLNESKSVRSRTRSASSISHDGSSARLSIKPININSGNLSSTNGQIPKIRRSFDSLPRAHGDSSDGLRPDNKAASLDFRTKPTSTEDSNSIYITPTESARPANESFSVVKGWLRKQNRDSIFKRIERYYCVLTNTALLMHRNEKDRLPHKAVRLTGARIVQYDDPKHGSTLELSWEKSGRTRKNYHLYTRNPQEAQEWLDGIQATIRNLEKTQWQQYRPDS